MTGRGPEPAGADRTGPTDDEVDPLDPVLPQRAGPAGDTGDPEQDRSSADEPPGPAVDRVTLHRSHEATLRRMFGRDFVYVFGGVLPLAVSALILPALTRIMGPQQFGISSLGVAISAVLYVFLAFGMQTGVQREYPKRGGKDRSRELITMSAIFILVLTIGLVYSVPSWAGLVHAEHFPWALELMAAWSGGAAFTLVCMGYMRSADRLWMFLTVVFVQSIGAQLAGVALLLVQGHSARHYLTGLVIGQFAAAALALVFVRPRLSGALKLRLFTRTLRFSLPLVPQQLANFVLWSGDRIVVQRDLGSTAQARYQVAYAVGAIAINVTAQLNQAWLPRVFTMTNLTERRKILFLVQKQLTWILSPSVLAISLAVPLILVIESPASYHPHTLVLVTVLVVPTALPFSVALANARTLLAHGHSASLALATLTCATINVVLNVLIVPHLGITGSAMATLVSYGCLAWISGLLVRNAEDRLPDRLTFEAIQWAVVGACIATTWLPAWGLPSAIRYAGLAALLVLVARSLLRLRRRNASTVPRTEGPLLPSLDDAMGTEPLRDAVRPDRWRSGATAHGERRTRRRSAP
ncbi:MAG: lipopolysaccharide biosynthesis protein [Acidimicrobiales bacterium]